MYTTIASFLDMTPRQVKSWLDAPVKRKPSIDFPDLIVSFFTNLPIESFDKYLKLNRTWYRVCKSELGIRRDLCIAQYWKTVEEYKKAYKALENCWRSGTISAVPDDCSKKVDEMNSKKMEDFRAWVQVDKAILRCGFPDLIDHKKPEYYIEMYNWGFDPYEIPSRDNDPENILGYYGQDEITD